MVLPSEENTEYKDGLIRHVNQKVKHRPIFGHMPEPVHDLRLQSTLKWDVSQTRQVIFDPKEPRSCPVQSDIRRIAKLFIGVEQVVEDQFEILVALNTTNNTIARWHGASFRS